MTAQNPGHGPGWHADLRAEDIGAVAVLGPGSQHALLDLGNPEAVIPYLADHVDPGRLPDELANPSIFGAT